jgi:hypothetical protein
LHNRFLKDDLAHRALPINRSRLSGTAEPPNQVLDRLSFSSVARCS